jgi:sulfonate transport system substrate-binding protein
MSHRTISAIGTVAALAIGAATYAKAQTASSDTIRIGYQKSSTLTAILKTNGELEKALAPLIILGSY